MLSFWLVFHQSSILIGSAPNPAPSGNEMDVTRLTEEEQIALAIQMSMSQADNASKSSTL